MSRLSRLAAFAAALSLFIVISASPVFARAEAEAASEGEGPLVVASTSWVGAIARAAGATNVRVMAPFEMQHPAEYELKPSDLVAASEASFVVSGGWERFASKLAETASKAETLNVYTANVPATLEAEALKLAEAFGTVGAYEQWKAAFDGETDAIKANIKAAYGERPVVVQKDQEAFSRWAGLNVVGVFGPAEPSPAVVVELAGLKPDFVIDNYHNQCGKAIALAADIPDIALINFPGRGGTVTLEDVFHYNENLLLESVK
jgi:hypothetical protein